MFDDAPQADAASWKEQILEDLPDGVALMDASRRIVWANSRFRDLCHNAECEGQDFFEVLGHPTVLGPEYSPFNKTLVMGSAHTTKLRAAENSVYELQVSRARRTSGSNDNLIAVVRDVTREVQQRQKLEALHQVGMKLADFMPDEVAELTVEERIELLKSNILHYTQDLLNYDVVEIRLVDSSTNRLEPLVAIGMADTAISRPLVASRKGNGITGFVAATGQSYLCEDTEEDPLYIEGFIGARSAVTVPLLQHDEVIGTFNVESPELRAFTEEDLLFIEIFARDVAAALNTLELLAAQRADSALRSVEAIHRAVAMPIDDILNESVRVVETFIGHDTDVKDRVKSILRNARKIKGLIQEVGQSLAPSEAVLVSGQTAEQSPFPNVRVLVVDEDTDMLHDAHIKLEQYGCIVETARDGDQALRMVRSSLNEAPYRVIISDVRLPDMSGHKLQVALKELIDPVPLVLMQGYGYDPGHSIVKARQDGLHPKALLFKPFRVDQLLDVIETVLDYYGER